MRHRWIRATGLGPAFLAAVVLAVSPVPAATAQMVTDAQQGSLRAFWDQQAHWFDKTTLKALRATQQPKIWEVLVDLEKDGEWDHQGFLEEVYRHRPEPSIALDESMKNTLNYFGTVILIGEVRSSKGSRLYVVAAVLEEDSSFQDSEGRPLRPLVPLHVNESYQGARRFAQVYEKVYDGSIDNGEPRDPANVAPNLPEDSGKALSCLTICENSRSRNYSACATARTLCSGAATAALAACALACAGVPACEGLCVAGYLLWAASCVADYLSCTSTADQIYDLCVNNCPDGGGGGCLAATQTATVALSLKDTTAIGGKLTSVPINFALSRAENRGEESFILDEWAIVQDSRVRASSNPAFALAVTNQRAVPALGSFLTIQEPVHAMNSRHVPKPEVRISSTGLAPSERGGGEVVAARLEFSPTRVLDRFEIVYTSEPMDESRLEKLVSRRVGLVFASEKGHRTAVYVVFRLTNRFELMSTFTALPKCCCGGVRCV
jgi:hypothetical protein